MNPMQSGATISPQAASFRKLITVTAAAVWAGDLIRDRDQLRIVAQVDANLAQLYGGKYSPVVSYRYRFEPTNLCGGGSLTVRASSAVSVWRLIPPEGESA